MKLWHSFTKELKLASTGFYFYVEFIMALIILLLMLFVIPNDFSTVSKEYISLDLPQAVEEAFMTQLLDGDLDGVLEDTTLEVNDREIKAKLYMDDEREMYIVPSKADVADLAEKKGHIGAFIGMNDKGLTYEYYLQGYEADRLKNLLKIIHIENMQTLEDTMNQLDVRVLEEKTVMLSDRENILPIFLTFNGSLMGLFIIAAYIFYDKQSGIIQAYAVTASSVWQYLMSKVGVVTFTSVVTSFLIVIPIMGLGPNYLMMLFFLLGSGFFASSLGLVITSFYKSMLQSFGALYAIIVVMIIPNIAYMMPSWSPAWVKVLPTYPMLESFKEIMLNGDMMYVFMTSILFFAIGGLLFVYANYRFKKNLTI